MANPALVLDALREHLEPTLLAKRLPSILQLAAHLALVRQRLTHEAALLETVLGAVDGVDAHGLATLHRLRMADGDALFDLSLDMRREQLLAALVAGRTATVEGLVQQYLPAAEAEGHKHIYVRAMEAHQVPRMAGVRAEVLRLVEAVKAGQEPEIRLGQTLNELGHQMMAAAETVVDDAEEFMALFPGQRGRESLPTQRKENPRKHAPRMTMPAHA